MKKLVFLLLIFSVSLISFIYAENNSMVRIYISQGMILDRYIYDFNKVMKEYEASGFNGKFYLNIYSNKLGTEEEKEARGIEKAAIIRDFIMEKYSLPKELFELNFYGNKNPILDNNSDEALIVNERVELVFVKEKDE